MAVEVLDDGSFGPRRPRELLGYVKDVAARLGKATLEKVLVAYFMAADSKTPAPARALLVTALGYVGMPLDAIPDTTPVVGFSDDLAVLTAALVSVVLHLRVRHLRAARRLMRIMGVPVADLPRDLDDDDPIDWLNRD